MSKIESGKTTLNLSDVNIADIVQEIDNIIRPQAKQKKQTLIISSDNVEYGWIKTDKLRLNQILLNILSNAVKYTPEYGMITFEIRGMNHIGSQFAKYKFKISDNGIGMSDGYIKEIFKPFTREDNNVTDNVQGTGLGMAITKNLIDLMGGTIKVKSKKGEGSTFEVTMEFMIPEKKTNIQSGIGYAANMTQEDIKQSGVLEGKKFLVAEDNVINAEMMREFLKSEGALCDIAKDGMAAVNAFSHSVKGQYDLIFMDVQMPNMDGYEATKAIRQLKHPDAKDIPIVAMTADAFSNDVKAAFDAGMNAHISKPVDAERIRNVAANFT